MPIRTAVPAVTSDPPSPRPDHRRVVRRSVLVLALLLALVAPVGLAQLHIRADTPTGHAAAAHRSAAALWSPHGARAWGSRLFDQWPAVRPRRQ
jgi:hypothetical protein